MSKKNRLEVIAAAVDPIVGDEPKFQPGDRVHTVGEPHMPEASGPGTVKIVTTEPTYGILFDKSQDMGIHKWYVESEIAEGEGEDGESSESKKPMKKMSAAVDPLLRDRTKVEAAVSPDCWYKISNKADSADVMIYDVVGSWGVSANRFVSDLRNIKSKSINVRMNTPGGDVFDGVAIANAIKDHPATVTCYVDGLAASIGSIIAMAGDKMCMAPNSFLMIHNPWSLAAGDAADMRKQADLLDKITGNLAQTYVDKSGMSLADVKAAMSAETWYTAAEAKAAGFCDEITSDEESEDAPSARASFDYQVLAHSPDRLRQYVAARIRETTKATPTATSVAANLTPTKETPMTLDEFKAFAAQNPDAVVALSKPASIGDLKAAFPNHPNFIIDQLGANASVIQAKAAFADVLAAEHTAALATKDAEIARLTKVSNMVTSGAAGVSTESPKDAPATPAQPSEEDPKALAEWEWDQKPETHQGFSTKDRYVAIRSREIAGEFRASGSTLVKKR